MNLIDLGWNPHFEECYSSLNDDRLVPARVSAQHRNLYHVFSEQGELTARLTGKLMHDAEMLGEYPAVGDWVAVSPTNQAEAIIVAMLPRRSCFSRKAITAGGMPETGGRSDEQVLAANIDYTFLVSGLDHDFNLRRIERYVSIAWESGATPVIILNKADLCPDVAACIEQTRSVAQGVDIHAVSAILGEGVEAIVPYLKPGTTAVFLGSSGVGKSSLVNCLAGEKCMKTTPVREDDQRGRHTTTHREMFLLPQGVTVIDTPGLRRIMSWTDGDGISRTFEDVEAHFGNCRFRDCRHDGDPGCAVSEAIEAGDLTLDRWLSYLKLQKEAAFLEVRKDQRARYKAKKDWGKRIATFSRQLKKLDPKQRFRDG